MQKELIERIAAAIGKDTDETERMLASSPQLTRLFGTLSAQDAEKLITVLSDKSALSRVLATPQAKTLMDSLTRRPGGQNDGKS